MPSEEDFWKVVDVAEGQDKVMLLAFLFLAARRKEIFRLTWSDVDFGQKQVRLWTRKRADGSEEFDWLPMIAELRKELRWWWENRPIKDVETVFMCLEEGENQKKHYGQPFRYRHHFMERLCEAAKVKPFGFHAIRHLTASILHRKGYELGAIKEILRHKVQARPNDTSGASVWNVCVRSWKTFPGARGARSWSSSTGRRRPRFLAFRNEKAVCGAVNSTGGNEDVS